MENQEIRINSINDLEFPKSHSRDLGEGASGTVKLVRHKQLNQLFALKQVNVSKVGSDRVSPDSKLGLIKREIKLHKKLLHPNIIRLFDYFKVKNCVFLLMELAEKGNLFEYLRQKTRLAEAEAVSFFFQTCKGVEYLHQKNVIHRDLKPENLLITKEDKIKICDFGWSVNQMDDMRTTFCGTYEYMAPEIVENKSYDKRVDIWSLGILLYEMLHGHSPFRSVKMIAVLDNIKRGVYKMEEFVSLEARQLISSILQVDPEKRPTIGRILHHPLLIKHGFYMPPPPEPVLPEPREDLRPIVITSSRELSRERPLSHIHGIHAVHRQASPHSGLLRTDSITRHAVSSRHLVPTNQATIYNAIPQEVDKENSYIHGPIVITSQRVMQEDSISRFQSRRPVIPPTSNQSHQRIRSSNLIPISILNNPEQCQVKRSNSNNSLAHNSSQNHIIPTPERSNSRNHHDTNSNSCSIIGSSNMPFNNSASNRGINGQEYISFDKNQTESVNRGYETPTPNTFHTLANRANSTARSQNPLQSHLGDTAMREYGAATPTVHKINRTASRADLNSSFNSISAQNRSELPDNRDNSVQRANPLMQSFGKKSSNNTTILNTTSEQPRNSEKNREGTENMLAEITNRIIVGQINKMKHNAYESHKFGAAEQPPQSQRTNILNSPFQQHQQEDAARGGLFYVKENYCNSDRFPLARDESVDLYRGLTYYRGVSNSKPAHTSNLLLSSKLQSQLQASHSSSQASFVQTRCFRGSENEAGQAHPPVGPKIFDRGNCTLKTVTKNIGPSTPKVSYRPQASPGLV